jgi:hypothetical protein
MTMLQYVPTRAASAGTWQMYLTSRVARPGIVTCRRVVIAFPLGVEGVVGLVDLDRLFLRPVVLERHEALERLARLAGLLLGQAVGDAHLGARGEGSQDQHRPEAQEGRFQIVSGLPPHEIPS